MYEFFYSKTNLNILLEMTVTAIRVVFKFFSRDIRFRLFHYCYFSITIDLKFSLFTVDKISLNSIN